MAHDAKCLSPCVYSHLHRQLSDNFIPSQKSQLIASLFALRSNAIQRGEAALKKQALWYRDRKFATALKLIFFVGHAKQLPVFLRTREGLIFRLGLKAGSGPDSAEATENTEWVRTEFTENYGKLRSSDTGIQRRYR